MTKKRKAPTKESDLSKKAPTRTYQSESEVAYGKILSMIGTLHEYAIHGAQSLYLEIAFGENGVPDLIPFGRLKVIQKLASNPDYIIFLKFGKKYISVPFRVFLSWDELVSATSDELKTFKVMIKE